MTERSHTTDVIGPRLANDPMLSIESIDPRDPMLRIEPSHLRCYVPELVDERGTVCCTSPRDGGN